jgi:predicted DNA-binding helix-hairpin-helix protein
LTRVKISFLFILGVCLVVSAVLRGHNSNGAPELIQYRRQFLTWNGSHITVTNDKSVAEKDIAKNTLPADLCPIFFHPIPLNDANKELLVTLPGIGPVTAELILRKRLELGRIISSEQLMSIQGIGKKTTEIIEQNTSYEL